MTVVDIVTGGLALFCGGGICAVPSGYRIHGRRASAPATVGIYGIGIALLVVGGALIVRGVV